jgi:hypothetical protein
MKFASASKLYRKSGVRFGERGAPRPTPLTFAMTQTSTGRTSKSRLGQIFLEERIVAVHQIMRRAIENQVPIMQQQEICL